MFLDVKRAESTLIVPGKTNFSNPTSSQFACRMDGLQKDQASILALESKKQSPG